MGYASATTQYLPANSPNQADTTVYTLSSGPLAAPDDKRNGWESMNRVEIVYIVSLPRERKTSVTIHVYIYGPEPRGRGVGPLFEWRSKIRGRFFSCRIRE